MCRFAVAGGAQADSGASTSPATVATVAAKRSGLHQVGGHVLSGEKSFANLC